MSQTQISLKTPKKHNQTYLLFYTKKKKRRRIAQMIFCRNQETISVLEKNGHVPIFVWKSNKICQKITLFPITVLLDLNICEYYISRLSFHQMIIFSQI
jgi:hypothetical protein